MEDFLAFIFTCGLPVLLPLLLLLGGYLIGSAIEKSHFSDLDRREQALRHITVTDLKTLPTGMPASSSTLVMGSVVVASDYFKSFVAGLRKIVGGEIRSFERLMERARREAVLRMLEDAEQLGASAVINVRLETSSVGMLARNPSPKVEVIAYGTAVLTNRRS